MSGSRRERFFERWSEEFDGNNEWDDDDQRTDIMAFILLGDVPVEMINEVLRQNTEGDYCPLVLADSYDNLPDYDGRTARGTTAPINENWRSPFVTLQDAVTFVRHIPKPSKPLCKVFCAVLDKERYQKYGQLWFVKVDEDEPQVMPCSSSYVSTAFEGMDRGVWPDRFERWQEEGVGM